jgi:triosephosphate isomerase
MKKLIAGNWKMHGDLLMVNDFDEAMVGASDAVDWLVCAPFTLIAGFENSVRGAQDCSAFDSGAYTGEISASMVSEMGADYCIAGHSERRQYHAETNDIVREKSYRIIEQDMTAIICVGETLDAREGGMAKKIVEAQILESLPSSATADNVVIAYEPVWAIGTGRAATSDDVASMHGFIRNLLKTTLADGAEMRILYGGSVKPSNASDLLNLDNVDGALIGGASLKSDDFLAIGNAVKI